MHSFSYGMPHVPCVVVVSVQRSSPELHAFIKRELRQHGVLLQHACDLLRDLLERARAGLRCVAAKEHLAPRRGRPRSVVAEPEGKLLV
jgi:hypothetical protein